MTRYLLILFIFFFKQYSAQHLGYKFIENKNQWPSQVRYKADLNSGYLFIENNGFVFNLYDAHSVNKYIKNHHLNINQTIEELIDELPKSISSRAHKLNCITEATKKNYLIKETSQSDQRKKYLKPSQELLDELNEFLKILD